MIVLFSGAPSDPPTAKSKAKLSSVDGLPTLETVANTSFGSPEPATSSNPVSTQSINVEHSVVNQPQPSYQFPKFSVMTQFNEESFQYKLPMTYDENGSSYTGQVWELAKSKYNNSNLCKTKFSLEFECWRSVGLKETV